MDNQIRDISTKNRRKRLLKRAVALLCVVVMLFTMNTLKRSANTLERIPMCGMSEHTHTAECYDDSGELVCGRQEHAHTDACYQESPSANDADDDLDLAFDDVIDVAGADNAQNLDLSEDLDQGGLLDFVQNANDQDANIDLTVPGGDSLADTQESKENDVAKASEENEQELSLEPVGEIQAEEAQVKPAGDEQELFIGDEQELLIEDGQELLIEDEQEQPVEVEQVLPVEDEQEQPVEVEQEQPVEVEQEQPAEVEQEQPVEEEQEQPVEVEQEQPAEVEQEQPVEVEQEQPAEVEQVQPVEVEQEQPVEVEQEQPVEVEQEQSVEDEQEQLVEVEQEQSVEDEQEQPVEVEQEQPAEVEQEQPVEEEQEQPVEVEQEQPAEVEQVQPVEVEQEQPVEEEQEQPAEVEQEQPVEDEQEQPVEDEQEQPVEVEQEQPVEDEQEQPAEDEQEQPAEVEEEQPVEEEQEQPVEEEQEQPAEDEQEQPVEEEQEQPVEVEQEQPAEDEQEQPAEVEEEQPVEDEQEQPVEEEQEQPVEEEQEKPVEEEQEQPAEDEQEQPVEDEQEQPVEDEQEQPVEDEQEQPVEDEQEQPVEEEQEQPAEDEQEQPAEDEQEQPAEVEQEQPAEDEQEQPTEEEQEQPVERHYTATVDLSEAETYPISLRGMIANATPAEDYEDAPETTEDMPVGEWSIEFDSGLFEAETMADDVLFTPKADFESAGITVFNGSRYELTLLNCVLGQPEAEAEPDDAQGDIAYPAVHYEQGTRFINVVVDAPEGAFPEGTVMVVEDVEDQDTLDNIEQSVTGDFVKVTSVHAVDISFRYNDAEIEPLLPISVVMSAVDGDAQAETPVVVHVDDSGRTEVVDSESIGTTEASLEMPATVNPTAQAFEADAFSIYGLVGTQTIATNYIDDSGKTWRIRVGYTEEAGLPNGVTLKVTEVDDPSYLVEAEANLESGKRITRARFFDIKFMDGDREVQPNGQVEVTITLADDAGEVVADETPTDVGETDVRAMHFVEQDNEIVRVDTHQAAETGEGVKFDAEGFSVWGVVYTVDFEVEGDQGEITLDFTAFDAATLPGEGAICYNTEDCSIHVALGLLADIVNKEAETGYDIDVNAALVDNYEFDFDKAEMGKADSGIRFEGGELVIEADGFVELTEGERLLRVRATGLTALKQALLETEGVSIEVIEGNVPLGSEASYTAHTEAETAELVENYINNEENGDSEVAGYSAADLKIVRNEETLPVEGQFKVTVDKASLVPMGMKLEKLYHIHRDENGEAVVEELTVEETEEGLVFEVGNFSDIVASYTVQFLGWDGNVHYEMAGGSEVLLSDILKALQPTYQANDTVIPYTIDDIAGVAFEVVTAFGVEPVDAAGYINATEYLNNTTVSVNGVETTIATNHDYLISTGSQPFDTIKMTLTPKGDIGQGQLYINIRGVYETNIGEVEPHTTTVRFFDVNSTINGTGQGSYITGEEAVPDDPSLQDNYYVLATYDKVITYNTVEAKTVKLWAVQPINLKDLQTSSASVTFSQFRSVDPDDDRIYDRTTQDQAFITTRLYRSATEINADQFTYTQNDQSEWVLGNTVGAALTDLPETGYAFGGGSYDAGTETDEIHVKCTNDNHIYKVRLRFSPGSTTAIEGEGDGNSQTGNHYFILAKVTHRTSGTSYAWVNIEQDNIASLPVDEDGYHYVDYTLPDSVTGWKNENGTGTGEHFTGQEPSIEVSLIKSYYIESNFTPAQFYNAHSIEQGFSVIYPDAGEFVSGYKVHYDTRYSRSSNAYYTEIDGNDIICYDVIDLTSTSASSDYDYTSILGPNLIYGIVAEHLYQPNHLQTNFAVNHFSGHGHDVRPDLSGDSAGNIVIGEFNISDGSKRNSVGEVATDPVWGRLKVGKPLAGQLFIYVDNDSGYMDGAELANVYDNPAQSVVVPTDGAYLSETIVEPGIAYMKRISAQLLNKPNTISPQISGNTAIVDATPFDDYDTIYIDGDMLVEAGVLDNTGGLTIKKKPNQTIVFNFNDRSTSRAISIKKFTVIQDGFPAGGYSTDSPEATGTQQNKYMDDIARHVVWNLAACTRKVTIDTAGGIFLQPNDDSEIEIAGTTAGWIVSDGYVYNGTAEWHNVFEEMPESVSVNLSALKRLDGKTPKPGQTFEFKLEKLNFGHNTITGKATNPVWVELEKKTNSPVPGIVNFSKIQQDDGNLHEGWNIFRITETGPTVDNTGAYITDTRVHYAAVFLKKYVVKEQNFDNIKYFAGQPRYYSDFDEKTFQPYLANSQDVNPVLTGVDASESEAIPIFENETTKTGLTLMKRVDGTEAKNKKFTFEIRLWSESGEAPNITKEALSKESLTLDDGRTVALTTQNWEGSSGTYSCGTVELRNGQKITFTDVPSGTHYEFRETKVGAKDITEENKDEDGYVDGYRSAMFTDDGSGNVTYTLSGVADDPNSVKTETFTNEYRSTGEIPLNVVKAMSGRTLLDDMFSFTVTGGAEPITGANRADGTVNFPSLAEGKLTFTQADMTGAKKNELGYYVKEVTYTIHEGKGTLTDAQVNAAWGISDFSYDNVVYDEDKTVTLVLTDKGDGAIEVVAKDRSTEVTVNFENGYKEKARATLTGTKIMEGRPMDKGEFTFNAVLNTIDDVAVPTQDAIAAATTDAERVAAIEAYVALQKRVSPVNVIGVNEAVTDPVTGTTNYSAAITFPEIAYAEAGTYVYTITEDAGNMPADAEAANPEASYTATVVVALNETTGKLESSVTYSPNPVSFTNRPKTINFDVTKEWLGEDNSALEGSREVTISLTYNGATPVTFANNSGAITQVGGSGVVTKIGEGSGTVSVAADGNIVLTSDESGKWPTAHFAAMRAGRYVVRETAHTDVGGDVVTTYALTVREPNTENAGQLDVVRTQIGNIVRNDNDLLTITNKASKQKKGEIVIHKVWKAGDTEFVPDDGEATFRLHYLKQWEEEEGGTSGGKPVVLKLPASKNQWGGWNNETFNASVGQTIRVTFKVEFAEGDNTETFNSNINGNAVRFELQYKPDGTLTDNKRAEVHGKAEPIENRTTTVTFDIPTSGSVDTTNNGGSVTIDGTKLTEIECMSVQLSSVGTWTFVSAAPLTTKETKEQDGVTQVDGEESFKITKNDVVNGQPWSKKISGLMMSDTSNNATWQYYVEELSNSTNGKFEVSYPGGTADHSNMATDNGTITVTNTTDTVNKKVIKEWVPSAPTGGKITLGLYEGTTEAEAAASTKPLRTIELDGTAEEASATYESPAWTANFKDLPKYDMQGNELEYVVKEIGMASGYSIVKYNGRADVDYVLASDAAATTDVATITNEKSVDLEVTKRWYYDDSATLWTADAANVYIPQSFMRFQVQKKNETTGAWELVTQEPDEGTHEGNNEGLFRLNTANHWTMSFSNLPAGEYRVVECTAAKDSGTQLYLDLNGVVANLNENASSDIVYRVSDSATTTVALADGNGVTADSELWIANKLVKFSVRKQFLNGDGQPYTKQQLTDLGITSVDFDLKYTTGQDAEGTWYDLTSRSIDLTGYADTATEFSFDCYVPMWNENGYYIRYTAQETNVHINGQAVPATDLFAVSTNAEYVQATADGTQTVTNTPLGKLALEKVVAASEGLTKPAGTYTFTVQLTGATLDDAVGTPKTVTITLDANGTATGATVDGVAVELTNGQVVLDKLVPGWYKISEGATNNGTVLTGITVNNDYTYNKGTNVQGNVVYEGDPATTKPLYAAVYVDALNDPANAKATFTNTFETVPMEITKAWQQNGSTEAPEGKTVTLYLYQGVGETEAAARSDALSNDVEMDGYTVTLNGKPDVADVGERTDVETFDAAGNHPYAYEDTPWHAVWTNLPKRDVGGDYFAYVVKEDPVEGFATLYSGNKEYAENGETITNIALGSLKLKKVVTVNGATPSGSNYEDVDGAYLFSIKKDGNVVKYVWIIVENGQMSKYLVTDEMAENYTEGEYSGPWYDYTVIPERVHNVEDEWVTVDGLVPGSYTIEENESTYNREIYDGEDGWYGIWFYNPYQGATLVGNNNTPLTVEPGSVVEATFTNDKSYGSLSLKKIVEANTTFPVNGNKAYTDGTYPFTVTGPTGDDAQTHTVVITMANGVMTGATLDDEEITEDTDNATFDAENGVRLLYLPLGVYTVTEGEWTISNPEKTDMYLKNIAVSPAEGNTVDKTSKTATVNVAAGAEVSAAFTNVLEPNEPNLEKQVTNLNDSVDVADANFGSENPWNKSADYDIGDQVPYRITTFLPTNSYRSLTSYTYIIHDTMKHLEYAGENGALVSGNAYTGSGRMYAFVKSDTDGDRGTWYDVSHWFSVGVGSYQGGQQTITVYPTADNNLKTVTSGYPVTNWGADTHGDRFPYKAPTLGGLRSDDAFNGDIRYLQFRYRATLKGDALIGSETGNPNRAYLTFSNSPTTVDNTNEDTNIVYTYKLVVNKQDENKQALTGAQFQLFKLYKTAPAGEHGDAKTFAGRTGIRFYGMDSAVTNLDLSKLGTNVSDGNYYQVSLTSPQNGADASEFVWNGIDDGKYILVETQAPDGYKALTEPVGLEIGTKLKDSEAGFISGYVNVYPSEKGSLFTNRDIKLAAGIQAVIPNEPYRIDIKVEKVSAGENPTPLNGAVFELYHEAGVNAQGGTQWEKVVSKYGTDANARFTVNGSTTLNGLRDGTYQIREVIAPAGYIITNSAPATFTVKEGAVVAGDNILGTNPNVTYTARREASDGQEAVADTFTIPNESGAALPATGGVGTGVVYGAGAALLLLAVLGLVLLNRKRSDGQGIR